MTAPSLPPLAPELRRYAAESFERANQYSVAGRFDIAIRLLLACCRIDPANLIYRQALRRVEKTKYRNKGRGSPFALFTALPARVRLQAARKAGDHVHVLIHGEEVLVHNPWHLATQLVMAESSEALGLLDVAIWLLEHALAQKERDDIVHRLLARLYVQRGNFAQAEALQSRTPAKVERSSTNSAEEAALLECIAADPTAAKAYLELAAWYRREDRLDEARSLLMSGLGPTSHAHTLTMELADLEIEPFRRNLAITESKLHREPKDERLLQLRSQLLHEINARELELFRRRADRYPHQPALRLELAVRLLRAEQADEAIEELQSIQTDPVVGWQASRYLGYCYQGRRQGQLAERHFRAALAAIPAEEGEMRKDLLYQLARGAAAANDSTKALALGRQLAELDPSYRDLGQLLNSWQGQAQES